MKTHPTDRYVNETIAVVHPTPLNFCKTALLEAINNDKHSVKTILLKLLNLWDSLHDKKYLLNRKLHSSETQKQHKNLEVKISEIKQEIKTITKAEEKLNEKIALLEKAKSQIVTEESVKGLEATLLLLQTDAIREYKNKQLFTKLTKTYLRNIARNYSDVSKDLKQIFKNEA